MRPGPDWIERALGKFESQYDAAENPVRIEICAADEVPLSSEQKPGTNIYIIGTRTRAQREADDAKYAVELAEYFRTHPGEFAKEQDGST